MNNKDFNRFLAGTRHQLDGVRKMIKETIPGEKHIIDKAMLHSNIITKPKHCLPVYIT